MWTLKLKRSSRNAHSDGSLSCRTPSSANDCSSSGWGKKIWMLVKTVLAKRCQKLFCHFHIDSDNRDVDPSLKKKNMDEENSEVHQEVIVLSQSLAKVHHSIDQLAHERKVPTWVHEGGNTVKNCTFSKE